MRSLLLVLALSSIVSVSSAQKGLHIGLIGSGFSSWILNPNNYGLEEYENVATFGSSYSVSVGYNFTKYMGIHMESRYMQQGQRLEKPDTDFYRDIELDYLRFPIFLKLNSPGEKKRFYFMGGAQIGVLLTAVYEDNRDYANDKVVDNVEASNFYNRFQNTDLNWVGRIGVESKVAGGLYLSAGLNFAYSMGDINAEGFKNIDFNNGDISSKNLTGGMEVGLHFNF